MGRDGAEVRRRPNMAMSPMELKAAVFNVPPSERNSSAQTMVKAHELLDEALAAFKRSKFTRRNRSEAEADVNVSRLAQCQLTFHGCAALLEAMGCTDFRVGVANEIWLITPMAKECCCISEHPPLDSGTTQLVNVGAREAVVLLANAVRIHLMGMTHWAFRIVVELYGHMSTGRLGVDAEWNFGSKETRLEAALVRFVLASLGVKVARKLFRKPTHRRLDEMPGGTTLPCRDRSQCVPP